MLMMVEVIDQMDGGGGFLSMHLARVLGLLFYESCLGLVVD